MKILRLCVLVAWCSVFSAQSGVAQDPPAQALTNVKIHLSDGTVIESGTIVWRNGVIEAIGANIRVPFDARVTHGGDSLHVYPGFIDGSATWGSPEPPRQQPRPPAPGNPPYERAGIQPERLPSTHLNTEDLVFSEVNNLGFTMAALGLRGNMLPGGLEVFHINGIKTGGLLFHSSVGNKAQFVPSQGVYPATLMSMMARFRQLWYDATALKQHQELYRTNPQLYSLPERDAVLEALYPLIDKRIPVYFHVDSSDDIERVFRLQDELGFNLVLVSAREAYTMTSEIRRRNVPVLVSIDIPKKPEWIDKDDDSEIGEEEQRFRIAQKAAWESERDNLSRLLQAGIRAGFASNGMRMADFKEKLGYLSESGLSEADLLRVFTSNTAAILGISAFSGNLSRGQVASFVVYDRPFSDKNAKALHVCVAGELKEITQSATSGRRANR